MNSSTNPQHRRNLILRKIFKILRARSCYHEASTPSPGAWRGKKGTPRGPSRSPRAAHPVDQTWGVRAEPFQQALADALVSPAPPTADNDGPPLVSRAAHPVHQALGCEGSTYQQSLADALARPERWTSGAMRDRYPDRVLLAVEVRPCSGADFPYNFRISCLTGKRNASTA